MNNFLKIFFLVLIVSTVTFCTKDEDEPLTQTVLRDFDEQYAKDNKAIIDYLKNHSITFDADMNPSYDVVAFGSPNSVWGSGVDHGSNLSEREFIFNDKKYIIYYIKANEGSGEQPCDLDIVYLSYSGRLFPDSGTDIYTIFDYNNNPLKDFQLNFQLIKAWNQIIPQFKTAGSSTVLASGETKYNDFGAGVMFVPSGFAYFERPVGKITKPYSSLIFSFKLNKLERFDNDGDGINSNDEDLNNDHYATNDDSDGDGVVNALDTDDDGDNVLTLIEIRRPQVNEFGNITRYPYNGAFLDDPNTPNIDERQGIPNCSGTDFTSNSRLRKHLDPNCQ